MNQPDVPAEKSGKGYDSCIKSPLRLDDFPELPVGILVYHPLRHETGAIRNLAITYCNPFALFLFERAPTAEEPVFLTDVFRLKPLFKSACHVLETGTSVNEAFYAPQKGCWINSSIFRKADQGVIYLQTTTPEEKNQHTFQRGPELETIFSGISTRLSNLPSGEIDSYLVESLAQIGQYNLVDRAYIFTYSIDGLSNGCAHEWCAEGIEPQQALFQDTRQFSWWHQKMRQQEIISLAHPDDLPASAASEKESLKKQGIQSRLTVPMIFNNRLVGFVGFDMVHQLRDWNRHDIDLLKIYSGIVISVINGQYDEQNSLTGHVNFATDISYLKHIEKELTQANQRIQLATTAGNLGVWEWNLQTDKLTLDKNFYALFELPDNVVMDTFMDLATLIHPDDFAYFNQNVKHTIQENKHLDIEFRITSPVDKSIHHMKADGIVLQDESTSVFRVVGIVRDRTAQKKASQALRESEKQYRLLVDQLKNVVFHIDINGLFSYLNPSWQTITGFSVDESLGKSFLDFVHPDDREHNRYLYAQLTSRQKPHWEHTVRYICKENSYCWMSVFAQVILDEADQIIGVTGTMTDVTERKKGEEALQESEQRFRDIAENVDEIFWIRDLNEPRFTYMNSAYERFTGQNPEHLYTYPLVFLTFIHGEDQQKVLDAFTHLGPETDVRFRATHQNGSVHWMKIRGFVVKDDSGAIIRRIGMTTDITSTIEKELILEEALKNERSLNYLKSQFISTASHEFRTPLATISSSVELLKYYVNSNAAGPAAPLNRHIDTISREVFSLNDLVTNTLTISKIEESKVIANLELVDLIALCETIREDHFSNRADNRHTELTVIGNPASIRTDRNLLSRVITNLLINAFKFSASNPVLEVNFKKTVVQIRVIDKGVGIPADDLPNLFGKFFRARNATMVQGTGLGLAICLEYVTLLKGSIDVKSKEGKGTTVRVTIPIKS